MLGVAFGISVRVYRESMTVNDDDLPDWTPATCTLPTAEQPLRVAEFDDLFRECVIAVDRADALLCG